MKSNFLLIAFFCFYSCATNVEASPSNNNSDSKCTGIYKNPVVDSSYPDPTIIQLHNGNFYLYATEDVRNVPILHSTDLINWKPIGTAFTESTRPSFVAGGSIWAPDINYINGKYVLY